MATVIWWFYLNTGECYHYFGGMIPLFAKYIATVSPSSFYNSGMCYHSLGGIILLRASIIATVHLLLSTIVGLW